MKAKTSDHKVTCAAHALGGGGGGSAFVVISQKFTRGGAKGAGWERLISRK